MKRTTARKGKFSLNFSNFYNWMMGQGCEHLDYVWDTVKGCHGLSSFGKR